MGDNIIFAEFGKDNDNAWFPKFLDANEILHYHHDGLRAVIGFKDYSKANR